MSLLYDNFQISISLHNLMCKIVIKIENANDSAIEKSVKKNDVI